MGCLPHGVTGRVLDKIAIGTLKKSWVFYFMDLIQRPSGGGGDLRFVFLFSY